MYYKFIYAESHKKSDVRHAEPVAYIKADNYEEAKNFFYACKRADGVGIKSTLKAYRNDNNLFHTPLYES
jgi:hypothetical protein